jgi:ABC-type lipoprotein release transport system permease subunit
MTFGRLLLRNLFFHWRGNSAVLLGVLVGTAVLTGALLVGDSLRGSLREQALQQLGRIDHVLVGPRLIRQELSDALTADRAADRVAPALVLQGAAARESSEAGAEPQTKRVAILGVDRRFWSLWPEGRPPLGEDFWQSGRAEVVLNAALARDLGVDRGGTVRLYLQKASAVPRESILGRKEDVLNDHFPLRVKAVLPEGSPGSSFNLNPTSTAPRNAFVPLATLQKELRQADAAGAAFRKDGLDPQREVVRPVNALLAAGGTGRLARSLARHLTLADWGLVLRGPRPGHPYLSLESRQLFLEPAAAAAAKKAARAAGLIDAPTLVYLADRISAGPGRDLNYAVVAALDPGLPPPLGPFLPRGVKRLGPNDIVLTDWKARGGNRAALTRDAPTGEVEKVRLTYYDPEEQDDKPRARTMQVRGWIELRGAADDAGLTPEFPGITDKTSLDDWDPPASLHYEKKRVTAADEAYWKAHRATPKAYVSLATGQKLWGSRYGQLTSIRLAPSRSAPAPPDLTRVGKIYEKELRARLKPEQGALVFDALRNRALEASAGSSDFGMLFLGFSVFLIAAALMLVGLLFRLNLERRAAEIGLLLAAGLRRGSVRGLLLVEGGILAAAGGVVGCAGAVLYAWLLLEALRSWWPGGLEESFLHLNVTAESFLIGYGASLLVSLLTIAWSTRVLSRVSPRALLAGETTEATEAGPGPQRPGRWRRWVGGLSLAGAAACLAAGFFITDHEAQASTFFGSGLLLLVASLVGVWSLLRRDTPVPSRHVAALGVRNAARHPARSLLTVGLLASATFLIVAVESFHRDPDREFGTRQGGSGGFSLLGESEVPLFWDLRTRDGRDYLVSALEEAQLRRDVPLVEKVAFYSLRLRPGDDASCLNLAQPRRPRLLGVPRSLVQRGGFHFQATEAGTDAEKANPWRLLEKNLPDGVIPVLGDATTVTWTLKSGLGKELEVPDENGRPVRLRLVGLLEDSIFQSELLMSDANFRKLYPHQEGFRFFLIDAPQERAGEVRKALQTAFARHGFTVTPTRERLETFLAVENTYLLTFQALGGLGLLLGALGLAVVLLRSVWERRGELALLRALGFRRSTLGWLVLAENGFLLIVGLIVGAGTALAAVAPPLLTGAGAVPWLRLLGLLGLVLVVGLAAGAAAVASTLRAPLLPALRRE